MRVLLTGATGFIGGELVKALDRPVVLSRNPDGAKSRLGDVDARAWNATEGPPPDDAFEGVDAVVHLAGDPVAEGRWNAKKKQRIRDSRVEGTRHLVAGMLAAPRPPSVFVSASAVGFYGDGGDEIIDESAPAGDDFLAEVCVAWEAETAPAAEAGIRVAVPRIGIVLGQGGGALGKMLTPFRLGVGGRLGSGRQWMPWVHRDDVVGLIQFALENAAASGPLNAVAPNPVTNREFTKTLARVLRRPAIFPAPGFALKLGLGEFAEYLLASQRVVPTATQAAGYEFKFPKLEDALRAAIE